MPHSHRLSLWMGRAVALIGILLVSANLRTAVSSISPIAREIAADVPLDNVALGLLGMIPPMAFAVSAIASARIARKLGLELFLVLAIGLMISGHLMRAAATGYVMLLTGSVLTLFGMGVANVLLPPLVKRYFADRIGLMTALYATLLSLSAAVPALVAVPVAQAADWRISLGMWSVLSVLSVLPWLAIVVRQTRETAAKSAGWPSASLESFPVVGQPIWRSQVAWALAAVFGMASFNAYGMLAWLPDILAQTTGTSATQSGALLALYAAMGLPAALFVPILATRLKNVGPLVQVAVLFFIVGDLGMLLAPGLAPWLWVVMLGLGPSLFAVCLVLINTRSRTTRGAVALSGFVQGVGYTIASLGPLLVGLLRESTGGWLAVFVMLIASAIVASIGGVLLRRPAFVEDEIRS